MSTTATQPIARAAPAPADEHLRIVIVGHVDHGKSTLVGRLMHDSGSLPDGKLAAIQAMSERRGMPFEWAFLMDAFQSERDQGITIDTAQIWFHTALRNYVIIDAPGHREFIKNMITGAASADAALLLIDAAHGVQQQSRLHGFLLQILGIKQIVVVVNKMDLVGYSAERFAAIRQLYRDYLDRLGFADVTFIPVSARDGDNIAGGSKAMGWYVGPTLLEALDAFTAPPPAIDLPLRLPIQDIYKFDERRILVGRIESGRLAVGDRLLFSPSNKSARVASIEAWAAALPRHGVGDVILRSRPLLALDEGRTLARTGRFVLTDGPNIVAGGQIDMEGYPDQRSSVTVRSSNLHSVAHRVPADARNLRNGHRGGVLWFTGLSGAGKSTLAMAVEQALFRKGYHVYVLDGDNVRQGLNANLNFSPEDRAENIRRVGEVAALFADAGMIAITAFISPYRADRQRAREAAHGAFREIYIQADLATCEQRDPKGLYRKARRGEIDDFTGISAPYEVPEAAELVIDTTDSITTCVDRIIAYVEREFVVGAATVGGNHS